MEIINNIVNITGTNFYFKQNVAKYSFFQKHAHIQESKDFARGLGLLDKLISLSFNPFIILFINENNYLTLM